MPGELAFRLGMLGLGHHHAPGMIRELAFHPEKFHLIGMADPDPEIAERRRAEWSSIADVRLFDSAESLLDAKLDGVVVEGLVSQNLGLARMALERGLPVLLERPCGDDGSETRATYDLAKRRGVHLQLAYPFRYLPAVEVMLQKAKNDDVGRIYEFRARAPHDDSLRDADFETLGRHPARLFFERAGHAVDWMCAALGRPADVKSLVGRGDCDVAIFGFDQAIGIVEVPGREVTPDQRRIELYGTHGAMLIPHAGARSHDHPYQTLQWCKVPFQPWITRELPTNRLQIYDLVEFAAVARGEKPPTYSMEHDLIVQEALRAACGDAFKLTPLLTSVDEARTTE